MGPRRRAGDPRRGRVAGSAGTRGAAGTCKVADGFLAADCREHGRPAPPPHAPHDDGKACAAGAGAEGVEPSGGSDAGRSAPCVGAAIGRGRRSGRGRARRRRQTAGACGPSAAPEADGRSVAAERTAVGRRAAAAEGAHASAATRSLAAAGPHASARMRRTAAAGPHARTCPRRSPRPPRATPQCAEARGTHAPAERPQRTRLRRATTSPRRVGRWGNTAVLLVTKRGAAEPRRPNASRPSRSSRQSAVGPLGRKDPLVPLVGDAPEVEGVGYVAQIDVVTVLAEGVDNVLE